jgi:DNA-directed RNA polymerase subunit omega
MTVSVEALLKQIPNRYQLVLVAARRTNDIAAGAPPLVPAGHKASKITTIALDEIVQEKVKYEILKEKKEKS